ncbi:hypothetical protein [Qipengyuania qiaonensis]|uniref:Uncharacterized protein n=1 Tax=Qipengyuania qiaonensis TaxID=2867240 RepID=A0ABS7JDP9_9SPHN|nr:hypothetical protein [Qipengyuania qiaonensis]MBX7484174.1 hypothetical protein [Qipengyuania qiaonensis]
MKMFNVRPLMGEPAFARPAHRTWSRFGSLLLSSVLAHDDPADLDARLANGFLAAPNANLVATATSCDRPLYFPECEMLAQLTQMNALLMRFNPLDGASFDVLLNGSSLWLCHYLAWRRRGSDLWLLPAAQWGPFFCLNDTGLEVSESPPYATGYQRHAGIIRAIDDASFAGRF